jgi:hypothetical protein
VIDRQPTGSCSLGRRTAAHDLHMIRTIQFAQREDTGKCVEEIREGRAALAARAPFALPNSEALQKAGRALALGPQQSCWTRILTRIPVDILFWNAPIPHPISSLSPPSLLP